MTARQFLRQAFLLDKKIQASALELRTLRLTRDALTSARPDIDLGVCVQTSGTSDRVSGIAIKIADLENELLTDIDPCIAIRGKIREMITLLKNHKMQLLFRKRYLAYQKWEQIAVDLDIDYRWAHILHAKGLIFLEDHRRS